MLGRKPDETSAGLDRVIVELENDMAAAEGDSEEYATMLNRLERLIKAKEKNAPRRVNPDTWIIVGGNLVGIVLIMSYEHSRVITSRALSFVGKLR